MFGLGDKERMKRRIAAIESELEDIAEEQASIKAKIRRILAKSAVDTREKRRTEVPEAEEMLAEILGGKGAKIVALGPPAKEPEE